ncbi:MAG: DUF4375 domain-containing protein [Bacilli bacterium]|nr:DUF4375 domain-containing protein [Bacilli bacterium]MBO6194917.1 DUF4375 domain-containing protein [Bacilli bacterium]
MISNVFKKIKFKIESHKVIKNFKNNIENDLYNETDSWNSFIYTITTKELDSLNEIQRKAVLCFWYDSEINSGGHNSFFENYSDFDSNELYNALKEISNEEIANNYKNALKNKKDDEKEDYIFYNFNPSLTDYLQKYVEENKDIIFN